MGTKMSIGFRESTVKACSNKNIFDFEFKQIHIHINHTDNPLVKRYGGISCNIYF